MKYFLSLLLILFSFAVNAADIRFSNHIPNTAVIAAPHNGNKIDVYNPITATWQTIALSNSGVVSDVANCYIDDIAGQSMPYNTIHLAYLKMNSSGILYINWLTWSQSGPAKAPGGFTIDARTQKGHLIGMAIRRPILEVQGGTAQEYVLSYYNRGTSNFVSVPAGTVSATSGWQNVGIPVEVLLWADDMPIVEAVVNFTGDTINSEMSARILVSFNDSNGQPGIFNNWGYETSQVNSIVGKPYGGAIISPLASANPGFWIFQMQISVDVGTVTLGALRNSMMNVNGKF